MTDRDYAVAIRAIRRWWPLRDNEQARIFLRQAIDQAKTCRTER